MTIFNIAPHTSSGVLGTTYVEMGKDVNVFQIKTFDLQTAFVGGFWVTGKSTDWKIDQVGPLDYFEIEPENQNLELIWTAGRYDRNLVDQYLEWQNIRNLTNPNFEYADLPVEFAAAVKARNTTALILVDSADNSKRSIHISIDVPNLSEFAAFITTAATAGRGVELRLNIIPIRPSEFFFQKNFPIFAHEHAEFRLIQP